MSNNGGVRGNGNQQRKGNGFSAAEQSTLLMQNRLNLASDAAFYTLDNRRIEKVITEFILTNMEQDDNDRKFMVQCGWNRAYDQVISTDKENGSDPFVISIYAEVTSKERGMQKNVKAGNILVRNTINRAMREGSVSKQKQFKLMLSKRLNACIASLAILNKRGELSWESCDKKGRFVECPLDPWKVLDYAFQMDDPETKDRFTFDITDVEYKGKGKYRKDSKGGERNPEFTMRVGKVRTAKNFKHANRDRFEFLARRRK